MHQFVLYVIPHCHYHRNQHNNGWIKITNKLHITVVTPNMNFVHGKIINIFFLFILVESLNEASYKIYM